MQSDKRLICFDLGRVLVRICDGMAHASQLARLPAQLPQLDEATKAELWKIVFASELGEIGIDDFCRRAAEVYRVAPQQLRAVSDVYLLGVYPGVHELLTELAQRGFATACLSNTNANHWRIMFETRDAAYQPLRLLTHRFGSHLIGSRKPESRIYQHVTQTLGIEGNQVIFFDDLRENVDAARGLGWITELIEHDGDPAAQLRQHLSRLRVL